jgi:hypothetical protein
MSAISARILYSRTPAVLDSRSANSSSKHHTEVAVAISMEDMIRYSYMLMWGVAFLLLIRRGFVDKISPYPAVALLCAFPWNIYYAIHYESALDRLDWLGWMWFCIGDSFMLYFLLRYSRDEYTSIPRQWFIPGFSVVFLANLGLQHVFLRDLRRFIGASDASYLVPLLFSMLLYYYIYALSFIFMLWRRNSVRGQSLYIALTKMLGTSFGMIYAHIHYLQSTLLLYLGGVFFAVELTYALLVYRQCLRENINPWRRL